MGVEYLTFTARDDTLENVLAKRGYNVHWSSPIDERDAYMTFVTDKEIDKRTLEEIKKRRIDLYKKL